MKNKLKILFLLCIFVNLTMSYGTNFRNFPLIGSNKKPEKLINQPISNIQSSPPSYQSKTEVSSSSAITSLNFVHITPEGENRLLVVIVGLEGNNAVGSCTYSGTSLILGARSVSGIESGCDVELWYMINPPTGSNSVIVNFSSEDPSYAVAMSYIGINQQNPIGRIAKAYASSGTQISVNITPKIPNSIIIGSAEAHGGDTAPFTPSKGARERYDFATGSSSSYDAGCWGGDMLAPTITQYTFGAQSSSSDDWAIVAVEFKVYDKTPPLYSNLHESANPLELGNSEIISIDANDFTGIKQVLIEFAGINHSMNQMAINKWQYDSWMPERIGNYSYTIWIADNNNNWNFTMGAIQVQDTKGPSYSDLFESADPLELGNKELISIVVRDYSGVNQVLIEFEGSSHIMSHISGDCWQYDSWKPTKVGTYPYTIRMDDIYYNWNTINGSIRVQDTIEPCYSSLIESANPLELGKTEIISINVTDLSGINQVLIEFKSINYTMLHLDGDIRYIISLTPKSTGIYPYTIWMEDNEHNWNSITGSIRVIDSVPPTFSNIVESANPLELGNIEIISITSIDLSGINQVLIEFQGSNHTMTNINKNIWQYSWVPLSTGSYSYLIRIKDNNNNWNSTSGSIRVIDTISPTYSNLIESADPLELYFTEVISINVTDFSGIKQVLIEFEGFNHSLSYVTGDLWRYDSWTPLKVGYYSYFIWIEDNNHNWNSITGAINVIPDITPPSYSHLIESADPLELGNTESISIIVTDLAGIKQVSIEFEGSNHSMVYAGGNKWQYNSWIPPKALRYPYTIWMKDNSNNSNYIINSILVIDTTPPTTSNLVESADPLELGDTEAISIKTTDLSGIKQVLIEFEGINHSMVQIQGNIWKYISWKPKSTGTYLYEIWVEDNQNNWNFNSSTILVIDTTPPDISNLVESADPLELGDTEVISVEATDLSGIKQVLIELQGTNHSMIWTSGNIWSYNSWKPRSTGTYLYEIRVQDDKNNWNFIINSISVRDTTGPSYTSLIESANPLELYNTITISINVSDFSGVNRVLIEFEESNHSMSLGGGNKWIYDSWTPSKIGTYPYTIWMIDIFNNWNSVRGYIQVSPDITPPSFSNLIESADPLELGNLEVITICISDLAGLNLILIEFDGSNHTMINIHGTVWQYNSWDPSKTGNHLYTIWMEDKSANWNSFRDSIRVVDTTPPTYSDLIESSNPLELGCSETILITVIDLSGIQQVLLEFEGINHSMKCITGGIWRYDSWNPLKTGKFLYIIYMEDPEKNWNTVIDSILVIDTSSPSWSNLIASADPLELGETETISIELTDLSGIKQVLIEFGGNNHTMINTDGNKWQYNLWSPVGLGSSPFIIWIRDANNNWNSTFGTIIVVDTIAPLPPKLLEYPSGDVSGPIIFRWDNGYDPSGIAYYRLIIDLEEDPNINPGFIFEINISKNGPTNTYYKLNQSLLPGTYYYFLYQIDGAGHQSNCTKGSFTVISGENNYSWIIIFSLIAIGAVVSTAGIIKVKRKHTAKKIEKPVRAKIISYQRKIPLEAIHSHAYKILHSPFLLESPSKDSTNIQDITSSYSSPNKFYRGLQNLMIKDLDQKRANLEKKAKFLESNSLYASAALYNKECEDITIQLMKLGKEDEEINIKKFRYKRNELHNKQEVEI